MDSNYIRAEDGEVYDILHTEERRQAESLELIPSENYASQAVREAMASALTNKYSEGYPGRRYYGGQEGADAIERLAIERAKNLFGAQFANVQSLGGANANIAVYFALLEPGDTVLGMELSHGGHLTHGSPVTYLSKLFRFVRYGMANLETGELNYDAIREIALREKPKVLLAGYSSYPRTLDWAKLAAIAHEVGAVAVADVAHIAGLIAGGAMENPLTHGFDVLTTTTHKTLRGPRGGMILVSDDATLAKKIDQAVFPGLQGGPHMHQIAAKAVALREAAQPQFGRYAAQVLANARAMADSFIEGGVSLVTGGTDNHLMLIDTVANFGMSGGEAQEVLEKVGLTVNKNVLPNDVRSPMDPSGIRLGTPAITSRGFTEDDCRTVARVIMTVLRDPSETALATAKEEVRTLCAARPIPHFYV